MLLLSFGAAWKWKTILIEIRICLVRAFKDTVSDVWTNAVATGRGNICSFSCFEREVEQSWQ